MVDLHPLVLGLNAVIMIQFESGFIMRRRVGHGNCDCDTKENKIRVEQQKKNAKRNGFSLTGINNSSVK